MSDEVLPADMCPIGPGAARAIEHARKVREGEDCGCDPGYHDEEVKMPKDEQMTVRQFLAIPHGERPTMMDAEALWNRIQFLKAEKDLLVAALREAISAAGSSVLIGHHAFLTGVLNSETRKRLVEEMMETKKVRNA